MSNGIGGRLLTVACLSLLAVLLMPALRCSPQSEPLVDARQQPEPGAEELVRGLLSSDINKRIEALSQIGVDERLRRKPLGPSYEDFTKVDDVRLAYVRLDDSPQLEAIITFNQGNYDQGVVLRRTGDNWYRVALFNCWCKYERDPLAKFLELRRLVDPKQEDLIVRDSLGGTGVYWRDAVFYRMEGSTLKEILRIPEERQNCNLPHPYASTCEVTRSTIFYPGWTPELQAIVVTTVKGHEPIPAPQGNFYPPLAGNVIDSTPAGCESYIWNQARFHFIKDAKATSLYCGGRR